MFKRGDIVVVPFPFVDRDKTKKRPALIISNKKVNSSRDYIMVQITSKEKNESLSVEIQPNDFMESPLSLRSFVRCHKIFSLNESLIQYKYSSVSELFLNKVIDKVNSLIESEVGKT